MSVEIDRDRMLAGPNRAARERLRQRKPIVLRAGINRSLRMAAIASWGVIAILSFASDGVDFHSNAHDGFLFMAYALSAAITKVGFARIETRRQMVGFSLAAVLFVLGGATLASRPVEGWRVAAAVAGALAGSILGRSWYKWRLRVSVR